MVRVDQSSPSRVYATQSFLAQSGGVPIRVIQQIGRVLNSFLTKTYLYSMSLIRYLGKMQESCIVQIKKTPAALIDHESSSTGLRVPTFFQIEEDPATLIQHAWMQTHSCVPPIQNKDFIRN